MTKQEEREIREVIEMLRRDPFVLVNAANLLEQALLRKPPEPLPLPRKRKR